jgi:hypothetical protein
MSNLEKLPTELLERVFFYCLNIDLPRSSPVIGGKLSSETVYMRTIIAAFGVTWSWGYSIRNPRQARIRGEGDPTLQV